MFLLQWDISESLQRFEEVAKRTFIKRKDGGNLLSNALELLVACIKDGQYSFAAVQEAFKATIDSEIKMFNPLRNDTKVAVTTTTTSDSVPCLFTNYNGGLRPAGVGYDVIRAESAHNDISVSEAYVTFMFETWVILTFLGPVAHLLRLGGYSLFPCSESNVSRFFKPRDVRSLGIFQDGGLQHNNPSDIAEWETMFLWPKKPYPDFALSLGTGTSNVTGSAYARFYERLFRNSMQGLDGERSWKRFYNNLPPNVRSRFHRLNLRFKGAEPRLDDASSIPALTSQVPEAICSSYNDITAVIDALVATMFYFELDGLPAFGDGQYQGTGYIFCRLDLPEQGRRYLYHQLLETSSWFLVQGRPVLCVDALPRRPPPFKRRVKFTVETLTEVITMSIRGITRATRSISGFPTTLQELMDHQQLDSPFGTVDHITAEKPLPAIPCKRLGSSSKGSRKRRNV